MGPIFLLLALTVTGCYSQQKLCPMKEDIKPCVCLEGQDGKPWVTCASISSADELREVLKGLEGYELSIFYLENSNIGVLPADIFRGLETQTLKIMFTSITGLSEATNRPPFLGLESSLENLEIREAFLSEDAPLARLVLPHLKKLIFLQLESNVIPSIGNDWFSSGPYGLKELHVLDSYTKKIGSQAFSLLSNLRKISITGGSISVLTRQMFPKTAVNLQAIDLSDNALSSLPEDMFKAMPALAEVYLENNAFQGVNEIVWAPIWSQITHVFFTGNAIKCDADLLWMYKYRLPEFIQGKCTSPESMKGKELPKLTLEDFQEQKTA